jgi:hypothetical protein
VGHHLTSNKSELLDAMSYTSRSGLEKDTERLNTAFSSFMEYTDIPKWLIQ